VIEQIHREGSFAVTYVKADGARMRLVKAPQDDEPVLPGGATNVVPILSARAIGEPLTSRIAHRVERIERVTGVENEIFTPRTAGCWPARRHDAHRGHATTGQYGR
jgi:probable selenium-dependent hydroxylase accessory protein YqeC